MQDFDDKRDGTVAGTGTFSVNIRAKAQSSSSCAFCWFILAMYPALEGMAGRDRTTFRAHLQKSHGLKEEIPQ
jgi:hypothetical protein